MENKEAARFVTFIAVLVLDVGLFFLFTIVLVAYWIKCHLQTKQTGKSSHTDGYADEYADLNSNKKVKELRGMMIFRFHSPINFTNAEHFRDTLYEKTGLVPRKMLKRKRKAMHDSLRRIKREAEQVEFERKRQSRKIRPSAGAVIPRPMDEYQIDINKAKEISQVLDGFANAWKPPIKIFIIDLTFVPNVDAVAVKQLSTLVSDYKECGIKVFFAGYKPDVIGMLKSADFCKTVDYNCLFFSLQEAVSRGREIVEASDTNNSSPVMADSVLATDAKAESVLATDLKTDSVLATGLKTDSVLATGLKADSVLAKGLKADSVLATGRKTDSVLATAVTADSVLTTVTADNNNEDNQSDRELKADDDNKDDSSQKREPEPDVSTDDDDNKSSYDTLSDDIEISLISHEFVGLLRSEDSGDINDGRVERVSQRRSFLVGEEEFCLSSSYESIENEHIKYDEATF